MKYSSEEISNNAKILLELDDEDMLRLMNYKYEFYYKIKSGFVLRNMERLMRNLLI